MLACIIFTIVIAGKSRENDLVHKLKSTEIQQKDKFDTTLEPDITKHVAKKHKKHSKKSKRDAGYNQRYSEKSSNFGYGGYSSNLPLYLVYNRKIGAYYPYYKYPKENSLARRNGHVRNVHKQ